MIRVEVTEADIRAGIAGDCCQCPAALALARATDSKACAVIDVSAGLCVEVDGYYWPAPKGLVLFVDAFDDLDRDEEDALQELPVVFDGPVAPFAFDIPDLGSADWFAQCQDCRSLFARKELDDEGNCPECREGRP